MVNRNTAAKTIQRAYHKKFGIGAANFVQMHAIHSMYPNAGYNRRLQKYAELQGFKNANALYNSKYAIKSKRNFIRVYTSPSGVNDQSRLYLFARKYGFRNAVNLYQRLQFNPKKFNAPARKIQGAYRAYANKRNTLIERFIKDLYIDGRFEFNVKVLVNLYKRINETIRTIRATGNAHARITTIIGHCHISANQVPSRYLTQMFHQMRYTATQYARMSEKKKDEYRNRLLSAIGNRPCLENLLDGMVAATVPSAFDWTGKNVEPLIANNSRYMSRVIGPALASWHGTLSKENKNLLLKKNLDNRKRLFWNIVKNRNLHVMTNNGPVYKRVQNYNVNGKRYFRSNQANALEYI